MHEPRINPDKCVYCKTCISVCPWGVYEDQGDRVEVKRPEDCIACNSCVPACPVDAITLLEDITMDQS